MRIVVVGASRRTLMLIKKIRRCQGKLPEIVLIHGQSFWLDDKMTIDAIGGSFGLEDIRLDIRKYAGKMGVEFYQDKIATLLPLRKKIMTDSGRLIDYDAVVFDQMEDWGELYEDVPVPGYFLSKPAHRILEIKNEIETLIEINLERKLEFVILGGGEQGVAIALQIEELLQQRQYPFGWEITIIEKQTELLPALSSSASAIALRFCKMNDINIITGYQVRHVQTNRVVMDKGRTCSFDMVICTYNEGTESCFTKAGLLTDDQGKVLVDGNLQVETESGFFAMGESGRFIRGKSDIGKISDKNQMEIVYSGIMAIITKRILKKKRDSGIMTRFISLGGPYAMINRGERTVYGKWCLLLWHWINRRFMRGLQT